MMRYVFLGAATAVLSLWSGARAARVCGTDPAASTYPWRVSDARYDGADPGEDSDGAATIAISIVPTGRQYGTFFECVASWPEVWEGWYDGGDNIIWSDCIWAGNGLTDDTTVSFGVDWANQTMYVTHTFACSDAEGSDGLGTGTLHLDMACETSEDGSEVCFIDSSAGTLTFNTSGGPNPQQEPGNGCAENSESYQSWELEGWVRQYEITPGSPLSDPPKSDTGPSFVLRNLNNRPDVDVFACASSGVLEGDTFTGTCTASEESTASSVEYSFDRKLNLLTITQHWECEDESSVDATGVGFVQATCNRSGDLLTCTSGTIWIGTKIV